MVRPKTTEAYDEAFYDDQAPGSRASASQILPIVFDLLQPASLIDVGCGVGTWLAEAKALGVHRVLGVDGHHEGTSSMLVKPDEFQHVDLSSPSLSIDASFELALCLEVAEHLEEKAAEHLVSLLCSTADVVVFSAAIPGQLGTGHVTLRRQSFWIGRFDEEDYEVFDFVRPAVWNDDRVDAWYRQNVLVFVRRTCGELMHRARMLEADAAPLVDIVHPDLLTFWIRRASQQVSTAQAMTLSVVAVRRALTRRLRLARAHVARRR